MRVDASTGRCLAHSSHTAMAPFHDARVKRAHDVTKHWLCAPASFCSDHKNRPRLTWRSDNSPRRCSYSTRRRAATDSAILTANRFCGQGVVFGGDVQRRKHGVPPRPQLPQEAVPAHVCCVEKGRGRGRWQRAMRHVSGPCLMLLCSGSGGDASGRTSRPDDATSRIAHAGAVVAGQEVISDETHRRFVCGQCACPPPFSIGAIVYRAWTMEARAWSHLAFF
jgi:hypothetical protein